MKKKKYLFSVALQEINHYNLLENVVKFKDKDCGTQDSELQSNVLI